MKAETENDKFIMLVLPFVASRKEENNFLAFSSFDSPRVLKYSTILFLTVAYNETINEIVKLKY